MFPALLFKSRARAAAGQWRSGQSSCSTQLVLVLELHHDKMSLNIRDESRPTVHQPSTPQHSRSVNHDRDSAHCSLHQPLSLLSCCMLCSPRVPLQTRTLLQRCSCRGSSCCVMINEAMKHAPHLTVPRVHSVYTYRVSTNTHRAQPSPAQRNSIQQFTVSILAIPRTLITAAVLNTHVVVTCFR